MHLHQNANRCNQVSQQETYNEHTPVSNSEMTATIIKQRLIQYFGSKYSTKTQNRNPTTSLSIKIILVIDHS